MLFGFFILTFDRGSYRINTLLEDFRIFGGFSKSKQTVMKTLLTHLRVVSVLIKKRERRVNISVYSQPGPSGIPSPELGAGPGPYP